MNARWLFSLIALCAAAPHAAFCSGASYPITAKQIAVSVAGDGLQVSAKDISMLADVVATVRQPALRLTSLTPAANHLLIARMECADAAQCLPFMVALHTASSIPPPAPAPAIPPVAQHTQPASLLVHAGSTAVLLLDGPHVHISLTVVCLENGVLGQMIRAANPDRSQFYTVQVGGDRLLRGRL